MKRFLSSAAFCSFLLIGGAFLIVTSSNAKEDVVLALLNFPAPPPPNPLVQSGSGNRPEEFFDRLNPPGDDAPIEDLLDYWRHQSSNGFRQSGYNIKPSERVLGRILSEIEKEPGTVSEYMQILGGSDSGIETVKRLYDSMSAANPDDEKNDSIKQWLTMNSPYFSADLEKQARQSGDSNGYVSNNDEFLALARVDWERARPIAERLYADSGNPASQALARWALYRNAIATDSMGDTERYRDELKAAVEDRTLTDAVRDLSLDALLIEKEWSGRDDWYYTLMEDITLVEMKRYTGLTTLMTQSAGDKHVGKMIELSKSSNPHVRAAAVRNLTLRLNGKNLEVVKALLPWLEDANWAKDTSGSRDTLVQALATVKLPESVPGLIAALNEKGTREVYVGDGNANSMSNMNSTVYTSNIAANGANMASNSGYNGPYRTTQVTYYPLRSSAIGALANQADMRAAPALRRVLPEVESYEGTSVVRAILLCNGYTVTEQADALETVARAFIKQGVPGTANSMRPNAAGMIANAANYAAAAVDDADDEDEPPMAPDFIRTETSNYANAASNVMRPGQFSINEDDMNQALGGQLMQTKDASEPLVREVIERIGMFEKRDPPMSEMLRGMLLNWSGTAINALLLRDVKNNKSDAYSILKLLSVRKELRENQANDVYDMRTGSPLAFGISACLLEDDAGYAGILNGENAEAKAAMLACARLIRARLPVKEAAKYVSATDKRLALAAENYLESEDSPEARAVVLALHPNEAKIMGARTAFFANGNGGHSEPDPFISALFASVNAAFDVDRYEYAMFLAGDFRLVEKSLQDEVKANAELLGVYSYENNFIRIYKDKAVYSWDEDASRYREKTLSKEAFDDFKSYLSFNRVDEMAPFLGCMDECEPQQLLMLGKQGGRRVFVRSSRKPEFFTGIEKMFEDMRRDPAKLHYKLEKDLPGLEILFADENLTAETVWKNGGDFRLLVSDKAKRKKIEREIEQEIEAARDAAGEEEGDYGPVEQNARTLSQRREYDTFAWLNFGGNFTGSAAQPEQIEFIPVRDSFAVQPSSGQWKAKAGGIEIRADSEGLYKIGGGKFTRIGEGYYDSPVITANGRWAVATKYSEVDGAKLVRVNLSTNREFPVAASNNSIGKAVAFVPATGKMLVTSPYYDHHEDREYGEGETYSGPYFWLDPETGAVVSAKGEVEPLAQQRFRSLQLAANAYEFWAAIPNQGKNETNVGIYNAKTSVFKPVLKIPKIVFDSMNMWVDGTEGKTYFVYNGHLLALPMKH